MNIYRDEEVTGIHAGWDIKGEEAEQTAATDIANTPLEESLDVPDTTEDLPENNEDGIATGNTDPGPDEAGAAGETGTSGETGTAGETGTSGETGSTPDEPAGEPVE